MSVNSKENKKKPSMFSVTMDLYHDTFTSILMLLSAAIVNRFKRHRDTANTRFDRITQ